MSGAGACLCDREMPHFPKLLESQIDDPCFAIVYLDG